MPPEWQAVHTCWLPGAPVRSLFCCSATPLWWDIKVRANAAVAKVAKTLVRKVAGTIFIVRRVWCWSIYINKTRIDAHPLRSGCNFCFLYRLG